MPRPAAHRAARAGGARILPRCCARSGSAGDAGAALSGCIRRRYVDAILSTLRPAPGELVQIDGDTALGAGTARRRSCNAAAGGAVAARGCGDGRLGACRFRAAVRPPGHHAEPRHAPWASASSATPRLPPQHAQARWGLASAMAVRGFRRPSRQRHTGRLLRRTRSLFYGSTHQHPCYPGTGMRAPSSGVAGNIVNAPLPPGTGSAGVPHRLGANASCRRSRRVCDRS